MAEEDLEVREGLTIPGWELWVTTSRASGAGGQHVNRTESRVTLHWSPATSSVLEEAERQRLRRHLQSRLSNEGVLQVSAETHRSQHRNREEARQVLADLVRRGLQRRKRRIPTRKTRGSERRRLEAKKQRGEKKRLRKNPNPPE